MNKISGRSCIACGTCSCRWQQRQRLTGNGIGYWALSSRWWKVTSHDISRRSHCCFRHWPTPISTMTVILVHLIATWIGVRGRDYITLIHNLSNLDNTRCTTMFPAQHHRSIHRGKLSAYSRKSVPALICLPPRKLTFCHDLINTSSFRYCLLIMYEYTERPCQIREFYSYSRIVNNCE